MQPRDPIVPLHAGLMGFGNQVTFTMALQRTKAANAVAMSYLSVVWGGVADFVAFHHLPSVATLVGGVVICSCAFGVGAYERKEKRDDDKARARATRADEEASVSDMSEPLIGPPTSKI